MQHAELETASPFPPALLQVVWVLVALTVLGLIAPGIPDLFAHIAETVDMRSLEDLGVSLTTYASYVTALNLIFTISHITIAAVIFLQRMDDPMAYAVSLALLTNGAWLPLALMYPDLGADPVRELLVSSITMIGLTLGVLLLFIFPDGAFIPRWTVLLALGWGALMFMTTYFPASQLSLREWPLGIQLLVLLLFSAIGVYAQIHRYRRFSSPIQRQQTKWAVFGLVLAVSGPLAYFLPFVILPSLQAAVVPNILYQRVGASFFTFSLVFRLSGLTLFYLILLIFPISFAIAILRYRLWDIDVIINRTLVYGALTATLALIFVIGVASLQALFRFLTGQENQLAIVVTTLGITSLFNPLRIRIQSAIDRRFYRQKYDAERALAKFAVQVRDEVDMDSIAGHALGIVEDTLQPQRAYLWLRRPEASRERQQDLP